MKGDALCSFRNRRIGFVFQASHLLPEFTALENVMMPSLIGGNREKTAREEAERLLHEVGLSERTGHKPSELSGGDRCRAAGSILLHRGQERTFLDVGCGTGVIALMAAQRLEGREFTIAGIDSVH